MSLYRKLRGLGAPLACLLLITAPCLDAQNRELLGEYKIGIVGRDKGDAIYQAAHLGARDAARELSERYSIDVQVVNATPAPREPVGQVEALGQLFVDDADGFALSPEKPGDLASALRFAREQGQKIVFFESLAEAVDPLTAIVADEREAGRLAADAILEDLPRGGRAAILINEDASPEMKKRLEGVRDTLGYKRIHSVVTCAPNYTSAIEAIRTTMEQDRNDLIAGWVFLGDWPLQGLPALPWEPGEQSCVAIQSSPSALLYMDQGYVTALIVHPYYDWGYRSVSALVEKLHNGTEPENPLVRTEPRRIDWRNLQAYREQWKDWLK